MSFSTTLKSEDVALALAAFDCIRPKFVASAIIHAFGCEIDL